MRYQSGGRPELPPASVASALSEMLQALGFRAMAAQAAEELDAESLRLYGRIILKHAKEPKRSAFKERLEYLGLL